MEILQMRCVECVYDFARVDVERYDSCYAHHFVDMAEQGSGKTFAALLLVLSAVRECRQYERNLLCSCLTDCIDCNEQRHNVVIHRKRQLVFAAVHCNQFVVLSILKNEYVFSADSLKQFCLKLAVCKPCELCVHFKNRRAVFIDHSADAQFGGLKIILQIDVLNELVFIKGIAFGNNIVLECKTVFVHVAEMRDDFISKRLTTRAGDD